MCPLTQYLIARQPLELDDLRPFGADRCLLVIEARFVPASRVGQGVGALAVQVPHPRHCLPAELKCQAVELRAAAERERRRRLVTRESVVVCRALGQARSSEMSCRGFDIGVGARLERQREPAMELDRRRLADVVRHTLTDAVVIGLDLVVYRRARRSNQALGAQRGERGRRLQAEVRCLVGVPQRDRLSGRRDDFDQMPRRRRQREDAPPQCLVQIRRRTGLGLFVLGEGELAHQLVHEIGISARLARNALGRPRGR